MTVLFFIKRVICSFCHFIFFKHKKKKAYKVQKYEWSLSRSSSIFSQCRFFFLTEFAAGFCWSKHIHNVISMSSISFKTLTKHILTCETVYVIFPLSFKRDYLITRRIYYIICLKDPSYKLSTDLWASLYWLWSLTKRCDPGGLCIRDLQNKYFT